MERFIRVRIATGAALLTLALLAGCRSEQQKAMDQAKTQAASTNTPQQIQYVDKNGDTVTTTVQPPAPGQSQQVATTITPPPPGPPPHRTRPVVTPLGASGALSPNEANTSASAGPAPANGAAGQPAGPPPALNLSVPAGTELAVRVNQRISVKHSAAGEHFTGEIVEPIEQNGTIVIPRGTQVRGRIDRAHRRGHFKGRSYLELRLVSIMLNGYDYDLNTRDTVRSKRGKGRRSAGFIGGMTGAGMLIGGVATGGVGLAIGGASGAGAGTLLAGMTGNRDIVIPAESVVHFRLADDLVVQ